MRRSTLLVCLLTFMFASAQITHKRTLSMPGSSFEMTVVAKDMSQADSYIDIAVAETSPNIPEIKGTGLGLSIAKRICDILNIEIGISSKENIGTQVKLNANS